MRDRKGDAPCRHAHRGVDGGYPWLLMGRGILYFVIIKEANGGPQLGPPPGLTYSL